MKLTIEVWLVTLFCAVVVYGIPTSENHKYEIIWQKMIQICLWNQVISIRPC
ncbi:hypothetical protein Bhyg_10967 [Pseudolycoriella hygida]|uniref:ATP synthase F0 subunit 8 n=1 Tax=Pseudolycoriella hygida TaxID=35572 RepID=A0A9Q0MVF0_9DIPT|nr:hypothetical protein Bhyg_10967 [Pseudolycoriella hygida]